MLRASNERANWSYSPHVGSISLQDATAKISGQEVATQCELRFADLQQTIPRSAAEGLYSMDAVVAKAEAGKFTALYKSASLTIMQRLTRSTTSDIMCPLMGDPSTRHEA